MSQMLRPSAEVFGRDFAFTNSTLIALTSWPTVGIVEVATNLPSDQMIFPFIQIRHLPGGFQGLGPHEVGGLPNALIQWDVFGKGPVERGGSVADYATPETIALVLASEMEAMTRVQIVQGSVDGSPVRDGWAFGWTIIGGPHRTPEPETRWARWTITSLLSYTGEE